jgi:hypothetical protein
MAGTPALRPTAKRFSPILLQLDLLLTFRSFPHTAPDSGSSSRKEEDPVTVTIDRPIVVLNVSIPRL